MGRFFYSLLLIVTILQKTYGICGVQKTIFYHSVGDEVSSGEFPWQVFLKPDSGRVCSGTIIGEFWILSSAQCFTEMTTTILTKAGELNLDFQGKVYPIRKLIRQTDYNELSSNNTLALLETSEPIMFDDMVQPACYPDDDLLDVNLLVSCVVSTMRDRTQDGTDNTVSVLKKVQFIPIQPCQFNNVTDIICATASNVESSDCTVNSGDALMCQYVRNKAWIVAGIAAFEMTECNTTVVFARTASYITWLRESTEMEGKPMIPEINPVERTEGTATKTDLVNYTVYYNEELPSDENPGLRTLNKKSKLEAGNVFVLCLFFTHVF